MNQAVPLLQELMMIFACTFIPQEIKEKIIIVSNLILVLIFEIAGYRVLIGDTEILLSKQS